MLDRHVHPVDPRGVARARAGALTRVDAERVTSVVRVLGDTLTLRVVSALACEGGLTAVELSEVLAIPVPRVVSALDRMAGHGVVVAVEGDGFYLARRDLAEVVALLGG